MEKSNNIIKTKRNQGTFVVSAGSLFRVIAQGKDTGNRFSLMEARLEPGQAAPRHLHTREDESFYILEGQVTFYLEHETIIANAHDFISCPPGTVRGFSNETNTDVNMLIYYSSAGIEEMTIRDGVIVDDKTKASDIVDGEAIQCPQLAEQYGIKEFDETLS